MVLVIPLAAFLVVPFVLGRLYELLIDEALALKGVESRAEDIRRELMLMKAFLKEIESHGQVELEGFNEWVDGLDEVTRNAEDIIQTFLDISVGKSWIFSLVDRYKVGKEVERISEKMRNLSQKREKYDQSHHTNISVEVQTSLNATEAPAVEKLSYILSENLVASLKVKKIVEEVKDEVVSMLKVVSNLKSKEQSNEREKVWLEEANAVCSFTVSYAEDFITSRRKWFWIDRIIRFLTLPSHPFPSERKFIKRMKWIKTEVRGALFRRLTYGVGDEDVGDKIGLTYGVWKKDAIGLLGPLLVILPIMIIILIPLLPLILISFFTIFCHHTSNKSNRVANKMESIRRDLLLMHAFFKDITGAEGLNERQKVWVEQIRDTTQQAEALLAAYEFRVNQFTFRVNQFTGLFRILFQVIVRPLEYDGEINYMFYKIHSKWERKTINDIANIEGRKGLVYLGESMEGNGSEIQIEVEHSDSSGTEEDPLLPAGLRNNYRPIKGYTKKSVQLLREELQLMKALFSDADEMGELDGRSKIWVEQMKDIAHEIEFVSNEYASKLEDKPIHKHIFARYDISLKIIRIGRRIEEASRIRKRYNIHLQTVNEFNTITTNLPLYLMRCLSYFVLFPPESEIPTRRLIVLWVAEGLVRDEQDQEPPEQVVERYLTELIDLNMVQVTNRKRNGKVKTCRLPNALRESPFLQARLSINLNSVSNQSITHQGAGHPSTNSDSVQKKSIIRQVADRLDHNDICYDHIHSDTITASASASLKSLYKDVLSFLSFDVREGGKPGQEIGMFLSRCISRGCFLQLRVLDLEKVYKPQLPENIARLSRLRYLGLRWTYLESLPSSISSLLKLQTLDLKHTYISILTSSIWKMQLRHLFLSETYRTRFPPHPKGNSLSDLQTLWGLFVDEKTPVKGGLDGLVNIRKLGLACQSMSLGEEEIIKQLYVVAEWIMNLKYLQSLRMKSRKEDGQPGDLHLGSLENHTDLTDMYLLGILKSPSVKSLFPPSLIELTLSHSNLQKDSIEILGDLPKLESLCLLAGSYIEETLHCKNGSLPHLYVLKLWKLKELKEWFIEEEAFPCLRQLEIRSCEYLQMLPGGLEHINTLRELKLTTMSDKFMERVRGVDKHKIPRSCNVFHCYTNAGEQQFTCNSLF